MSTYKDLTDALPSRIGRPNKFGVPPAYFEAEIEPLIEEYAALFGIMQAPPSERRARIRPSRTLSTWHSHCARQGPRCHNRRRRGSHQPRAFFAETNGKQNIGNARSNTYKGSLQTGTSEDQKGRKRWAAIKKQVSGLDPAVAARDDKEEARVGKGDQRYNHWTAVRNGLMKRMPSCSRRSRRSSRRCPMRSIR